MPAKKFILFNLAVGVGLLLWAVFREEGLLALQRNTHALDRLQQENSQLKIANANMREDMQALKSDPVVLEKIAREKLKMVKPGEVVFQIVRGMEKKEPAAAPAADGR